MSIGTHPVAPRFKVGDGVTVLTPGPYKNKDGVVKGVIGHTGDFVFRYDVLFSDGQSKRFFGFEIDLLVRKSA